MGGASLLPSSALINKPARSSNAAHSLTSGGQESCATVPVLSRAAIEFTHVCLSRLFSVSFCDGVLDWNRDQMLHGNPDQAITEEHRRTLKWIIRFTRLMPAEVSDLDFPSRQLAQRLAVRLHQLEAAWGTFHDHSLSAAEADRILAQAFPDER